MHIKNGLAAALLVLCALFTGAPSAADPIVAGARPLPTLAPEDVVRIQLEALRRNDTGDGGIAIAFRFATPDNRRSTGPLSRFARMIKQGPFALMLTFTVAEYGPVEVVDRRARQRVTLFAPGVAPVTYVFYLERQAEQGPLMDCWMTAGVQAVPGKGQAA